MRDRVVYCLMTSFTVKRSTINVPHYVEYMGTVGLEMIRIPGGSFMMGSLEEELGHQDDEGPQHEVTVPIFAIGRYPVTQAQWRAVAQMKQVEIPLEEDPAEFKGPQNPVEQVSWEEAVEFCQRLTRHTGWEYRLPSEAEWEYACRAATTTPFHFGETLTVEVAKYDASEPYGDGPKGEYQRGTTPVGSFPSNAFGLSDMHGNVLEWCADHFHGSYEDAPTDGSAWIEGGDAELRILRGGSWSSDPRFCRSAFRNSFRPAARFLNIGFRVVCVAPRT